jgi:hypothetical protein
MKFQAIGTLLVGLSMCSNFAINLARYSTECFYEDLKHGDRLEISFEVMSSSLGEFEIDFQVDSIKTDYKPRWIDAALCRSSQGSSLWILRRSDGAT